MLMLKAQPCLRLQPDPRLRRAVICKATSIPYHLFPAMIGSAIAFTSTYPLDTYKTRVQNSFSPEEANPKHLFKGYKQGFCLCMTTAFTYFHVYSKTQLLFPDNILLASAVASFVSSFLKVPGKAVTKLLQNESFKNMASATTAIYSTYGLAGFYRGFLPYVIDEVPDTAIKFYFFSFFQKMFPTNALITGLASGALCSVLTQPLDVLQTKFMCDLSNKSINYRKLNYLSGALLSLAINTIQTTVFYQTYQIVKALVGLP